MPPVTLTQLPREIRDRIYDFVFPEDRLRPITESGTRIFLNATLNGCSHEVPNQALALLLVNHQVSAEAKVSFYSTHGFVGQTSQLLCFLEGIGERRNLIRNIEVEYVNKSYPLCERWIRDLFGLVSYLPELVLIKLHMAVTNFKAAEGQLELSGFNRLERLVEDVIYDLWKLGGDDRSNDREVGIKYHNSIWRRAKGATNWVQEKEEIFPAAEILPGNCTAMCE